MNEAPNVHAFPGVDLPVNPIAIEGDKWRLCGHESIRVDIDERTIRCAHCDAVLDPFNFVLGNAKLIQHAWDRHRQVMAEAKKISDRVHELKKEEKRLRATVKRLRDKSSDVISVRGETR